MASGIDEIFAQFKVIKMEELRSLTPDRPAFGKGKLLRNSNVTVIQIMPSERANRRIDKEIRRRTEASDLEVITVTPVAVGDETSSSSSLLKLHILNIRTGKIQDAIISSDERETFVKPKPFRKKSTGKKPAAASDRNRNLLLMSTAIIHFAAISSRHVNGGKEIIRIQPHAEEPETTFNEINHSKKFLPIKPYKLRNKFTSSKCKCEDNARMWNCRKIQISIARCRSDQFLCCSGF